MRSERVRSAWREWRVPRDSVRALMGNITRRRLVCWYLCVVATLTVLSGVLHGLIAPPMGLVRTFYATSGFSGEPLSQDRTTEISLAFLDQDPTLPRRFISVEWRGFWFLPQAQTVDVYAGADDRVDVLVDGQLVLQRSPRRGMHTIGEPITLSAGSHTVTVRYEQDGDGMHLNVQRAFSGARPAPFTPTRLFPKVPNVQDVRLATGTYWLLRVVVLLWLLSIAGLLVVIVGWTGHRVAHLRPWRRAANLGRKIQSVFVRVTRLTVSQTLHVFALTALAVAHPLFDVVSREPVFLVARNTTTTHLVVLVALVCFALPAVIVSGEVALARVSARAARVAHGMILTTLGGALLMPLMKRADVLASAPATAAALLVAGTGVIAYHRSGGVRSFMTALSPAIVVVPAAFLLNPVVWEAVVRTNDLFSSVHPAAAPPIVIVVFDEFPVSSLLDGNREIDRVRYPNFARLATTATWYRNASTVSSQTVWAVPAIVTGQYPVQQNAVPTRRYYPNNLFTMLRESYRMIAFGRFLQLCPTDSCGYDLEVRDSLSALVADLGIVYLHVISPDSIAAQLPPILGDWMDFVRRREFRNEDGERRWNDRASEFDRFLETITPDREGRLYFIHTLTPHMAFEYVPSGHRYLAPDYQAHEEDGERLFLKSDPWLPRVLQQRHLLQVGFVDRLIGDLVDRLRAQGIYDETLIIITADHGTSFRHGRPRRSFTEGTRADVMMVPLIVKFPGQAAGLVSDQNVETVDIVPTIASVLSTTVPYDVDGRSLLDVTQPDRTHKTFIQRSATRVSLEKHGPSLDDRYVGLEQKLLDFESGLYALGPHASLVGLELSTLEVPVSTDISIRLDDPSQFVAVDLESHTLSLFVRGALPNGIEARVSVAIAVNGVVVATTQSYLEHDEWVVSSMIPEGALTPGANDVQVLIIDGGAEEPVMRSAVPGPP